MLEINEIFDSVQGEGVMSGIPTTFVRLQGCNLRCPWCDTETAQEGEGLTMTPEDIVRECNEKYVVLTGGEPTLQDIRPLIAVLNAENHTVGIETNGTLKLPYNVAWLTVSPKRVIGYFVQKEVLQHANEIKFVVEKALTSEDILNFLIRNRHDINEAAHIVFMAEGCPPTAYKLSRAKDFTVWLGGVGYKTRMCDRLQWRFDIK